MRSWFEIFQERGAGGRKLRMATHLKEKENKGDDEEYQDVTELLDKFSEILIQKIQTVTAQIKQSEDQTQEKLLKQKKELKKKIYKQSKECRKKQAEENTQERLNKEISGIKQEITGLTKILPKKITKICKRLRKLEKRKELELHQEAQDLKQHR
ncbi:UNVERIFIED_CONTAM: hypothetical protein K2H54_007442 [Gekko kuhli]